MAGWPVIGHEWAVDLLERAILGDRLSHAYLLTGPAQVGKTTLARAFAQALLCEVGNGVPCGVCRNLPACGRRSLSRLAVRDGREEHDPDRAGARPPIRCRPLASGRPAQDLHHPRDRTGYPAGRQCAAQDPGRTISPRDIAADLRSGVTRSCRLSFRAAR